MKIAVIGGVGSTEIAIKSLHSHSIVDVTIYGYEPTNNSNVSGYTYLEQLSSSLNYEYHGFIKINDQKEKIISSKFDLIMVIGLSQLVCDEIVDSALIGCYGFHPTLLPKGRGRAPIAWLVLNESKGAASIFRIKSGEGADAGDIVTQVEFAVESGDDAKNIEQKVLEALEQALDGWLPQIKKSNWLETPQNHELATEYGIRRPSDGFVDWNLPADNIQKIIAASSFPHPGAFVFIQQNKFLIELSELSQTHNIQGVIGRVLKVKNNNYLIQTGTTPIWIQSEYSLRVGEQLGVSSASTLHELYSRLNKIEEQVAKLYEQ